MLSAQRLVLISECRRALNLLPLVVCFDGTKVKLKLRFSKAVCLAGRRFVCGIHTFHYTDEISKNYLLVCFVLKLKLGL